MTERKPKIRFKGFSNAWEQRKAKELFISTADKGYPDLPVLSATQDRGMIRRDENSINIFHDKKNEAGYKRVLPGQFVIHLRSFQGGFAHSAIEGITSPAYTVFGFSEPEKHDSEYWKYVFTSKAFIRRLETVTYGIRDGRSISYDEFLTLSFVYPSKAEQTAIARHLDKLSTLLTLHQRKLDKLQTIKKALLEKMFPKNGESVPEIRFKGFSDAWEQRKLSDNVSYDSSNLTVKDGKEEGLYDLFDANGFIGRTDFRGFSTEYISIIKDGASVGRIRKMPPKTMIIGTMGALQAKNADLSFVFALLSQFELNKTFTGSTIPHIYFKDYGNNIYFFPQINEQKSIGMIFSAIDDLITLHQRKLDKLQMIKKALLEKMFV